MESRFDKKDIEDLVCKFRDIGFSVDLYEPSGFTRYLTISGYKPDLEISFRIKFGEKLGKKPLEEIGFYIEHRYQSRLNREILIDDSCTQESISGVFNCFMQILKDMIFYDNKINESLEIFPRFTKESNREWLISKVIE